MMNGKSLINTITPAMPRNLIHCDVGARWGIGDPWKSFRAILECIRFEPDKQEYESLMKNKSANDMIYQYALYRESRDISFHLTKSRGCSSLYKPNYDFLGKYPDSERFEIDDITAVTATSLDILHRDGVFSNMDFVKIDVQGAELDILKGGEAFLRKHILGIEIEVEFQSLYKEQPLFSDVDIYIRESLALQIQDLRKTYWKYPVGIGVGAMKGQLIFGDALYFRSPYEILPWCSHIGKKEAANKILMACLMGIVYGYLDYSLCLLNQPSIVDYLEQDTINHWRTTILHYGKSLKYNGKGNGILAALFNYVYRICLPTHKGWAVNGHHLGMRKKYGVFY